VPSVMRRVPVLVGAGLICAIVSCASTTILKPTKVVNDIEDSFCIASSVRQQTAVSLLVPLSRSNISPYDRRISVQP
jgi:hypothetical protein